MAEDEQSHVRRRKPQLLKSREEDRVSANPNTESGALEMYAPQNLGQQTRLVLR